MLYRCKYIVVVFSLLILVSCTSPEYKKALADYEVAKTEQNLKQLSLALKTLTSIAPDKFQSEFIKVEKAHLHLQTAENELQLGNNYAAYIASHNSYRSIPNSAAKNILIKAGKELLPLLKATLSIEKYLNIQTKELQQKIEQQSKLSISDWNLITVNNNIEQLSIAYNELETAANLLLIFDEENHNIPNLYNWQRALAEQQQLLKKVRHHFANVAQYHSANLLKTLNDNLTSESIKLLSLVRQEFAKESMQKKFIQSQDHYSEFQNIVENVALAENLTNKDKHANWYQKWQNLEKSILEPKGNFKNYPIESKDRNKKLLTYLDIEIIQLPSLTSAFNSEVIFNNNFNDIIELTDKLKIDKTLIF